MGYYSEVAIALKKKDFIKMMKDAIKAAKEDKHKYILPLLINGYMKCDNWALYDKLYDTCETKVQEIIKTEKAGKPLFSRSTKKDYVILHWDMVKWYYDDAKWVEKAFHQFDYYEFVRVGEERDDIEEEHETDDDWLIESYRSICING